jgi:hypothetical protein
MPHCYIMFRRGSTSIFNSGSDVINIRSAGTQAKTNTVCTEAEAETKTETAKKRSRKLGLATDTSSGDQHHRF